MLTFSRQWKAQELAAYRTRRDEVYEDKCNRWSYVIDYGTPFCTVDVYDGPGVFVAKM